MRFLALLALILAVSAGTGRSDESRSYISPDITITAFDRLRDGGRMLSTQETQAECLSFLEAVYIGAFSENPTPIPLYCLPIKLYGTGTYEVRAVAHTQGFAHENISWYGYDPGDRLAKTVTLNDEGVIRLLVFLEPADSVVVFLNERPCPLSEVR